jgi:hypothetical protein
LWHFILDSVLFPFFFSSTEIKWNMIHQTYFHMLNKGFLKYGDEEKEKYFYVQINFVTKFFPEKARIACMRSSFIFYWKIQSSKSRKVTQINMKPYMKVYFRLALMLRHAWNIKYFLSPSFCWTKFETQLRTCEMENFMAPS